MDTELILFFTMNGLNIVCKGGAEKIKLEGFSSVDVPDAYEALVWALAPLAGP